MAGAVIWAGTLSWDALRFLSRDPGVEDGLSTPAGRRNVDGSGGADFAAG